MAHFNFAGKGGTRTKSDLRRKWPRCDLQGSSGNEVLRTGHQGDLETLSVSFYVRTENIRESDSRWEEGTCNLVPNVSLISTGNAIFEVTAAVFRRIPVFLDMKLSFDRWFPTFRKITVKTCIAWSLKQISPRSFEISGSSHPQTQPHK